MAGICTVNSFLNNALIVCIYRETRFYIAVPVGLRHVVVKAFHSEGALIRSVCVGKI